MRTATSPQQTDLEALHRQELIRIRIEDHASTLQEYTVPGGASYDWLLGGRVERTVERRAATCSLSLRREIPVGPNFQFTATASTDLLTAAYHDLSNGDTVTVVAQEGASLASGLSAGTLYYVVGVSGDDFQLSTTAGGSAVDITADGTGEVRQVVSLALEINSDNPIDIGREVRVDLAVIAVDATVAASDWEPLFVGFATDVAWASTIDIDCVDESLQILDQCVTTKPLPVYSVGDADLVEEVIQDIWDEELGVDAPTLEVPSASGWGIREYTQQFMTLDQATQVLLDDLGATLFWEWSEANQDFRPTFRIPDRDKTTPDYTFTTARYYDITDLRKSTANIRNKIIDEWEEETWVTATDSASIAEFQGYERSMEFNSTQDPQIDSASRATTFVTAVLKDLAQPTTTQVAIVPIDWRFELNDLYRWPANSVHYATDKDLAVTSITWEFGESGSGMRCVLGCRGKPSGGSKRWHVKHTRRRRASDTAEVLPISDTIVPTVETKLSQSNGTGTLVMVINDPDGLVNAVGFQPQQGGGSFDLSTDPTTWDVWDTSDPFTLTDDVSLVSGHPSFIGWAVRYNTGTGNVFIRGVATFDADEDADIQSAALGFTDAGQVVATVKADPDTACILFELGTGSDPGSISLGTSSTTQNAESPGSTQIELAATIGAAIQDWLLIAGTGGAELVRVTSVPGGGTYGVTALANAYDAGATVSFAQDNSTNTGGAINGSAGTVTTDDSTGVADFTADIGSLVFLRVVGINARGELGTQLVTSRRRGDSDKVQPKVIVQATRSGSSVSVSLTITDPTLGVSANPSYKRRDGDDQSLDGSWQTSWDTSTGTAGTDATLTRAVTLADPYTALVWRVQWTDENGDAQEIGDELDLASVQEVEKQVVFEAADWRPESGSTDYVLTDPAAGAQAVGNGDTGSNDQILYLGPVFPPAVELTHIACPITESGSGSGFFEFFENQTVLASWAPPTTPSSSLSTTTAANKRYVCQLTLNGGGGAEDAQAGRVTITYNAPSFKQTY